MSSILFRERERIWWSGKPLWYGFTLTATILIDRLKIRKNLDFRRSHPISTSDGENDHVVCLVKNFQSTWRDPFSLFCFALYCECWHLSKKIVYPSVKRRFIRSPTRYNRIHNKQYSTSRPTKADADEIVCLFRFSFVTSSKRLFLLQFPLSLRRSRFFPELVHVHFTLLFLFVSSFAANYFCKAIVTFILDMSSMHRFDRFLTYANIDTTQNSDTIHHSPHISNATLDAVSGDQFQFTQHTYKEGGA